ncbi:MAG TPA: hypothetical protein V6C58_20145, partial [Allocoleopsis sp.]
MKKTQKRLNYYRLLVSSALITGGLFQLALPVFAAGTLGGTNINNTATATYEDPNNPTTPLNATSNQVSVTVANVAGITNVGTTITDSTPATGALPGDQLTYKFTVTNTSNFDTPLTIPSPVLIGALDPLTAASVTYQVYNAAGAPVGGSTTTAPTTAIPRDGRVEVTVLTTVNSLAQPGGPLTVQLGDTGSNNNDPVTTQNQPVGGTTPNVQTNAAGASPAITPVNGEREASATLTATVAAPVNQKAFAAVLKTSQMTDVNNTPAILSDNTITYNLQLRVDATAPSNVTGYAVADLAPTTVKVNGTDQSYILVSDIVPANTTLQAVPTAPTGWTVVYSADNTSTVDQVQDWTTTAPTNSTQFAAVKRVGFVKSGTQAKGTLVTGFTFKVTTSGISNATGGSVNNIAQLLGTTQGVPSTDPNYKVYDESGDNNPSNFNDAGAPGNQTPTTGVANPATDGTDPGNNNTGSDVTPTATSGGESNVVTLSPLAATGVLNGPLNQSAAVGPTNNNDDFTNKAVTDLPATPPNTGSLGGYDPAAVTFTNTVGNPDPLATLNNIEVRPYTDGTTGGATNVPAGTTVTITYTPTTGPAQTATYTYNGTQFTTIDPPVTIPQLVAGQVADYTVTINMPAGLNVNTSYSVPISAYVDGNGNDIPDDTVTNRTIDRIWAGY